MFPKLPFSSKTSIFFKFLFIFWEFHTLNFVHILSSPLTESFQIHPSLLSQIHGFPSS